MLSPLLNLIRNNPQTPGALQIHNADSDHPELFLYDAIGDWFGISAESIARALNDLSGKTVTLRINSPGGDVFEGRAMASAIAAHPGGVTAKIEGLAASAATYVALAAREVVMVPGSFFMIHNAWTLAMGNASDLDDTASLLRKVDDSIRSDYQRKTGQSDTQISDWMNAETWFTADEALQHGFVDRLAEPDASTANTARRWNLAAYQNTPQALLNPPGLTYDRARAERRLALLERTGS